MKNIFLILSSVLLNCSAQLLIRKGMMNIGDVTSAANLLRSIPAMISNAFLWAAIACYAFSLLLWMAVLSKVEVSYAYPFNAAGYVITCLAGFFLFSENINPLRIAGTAVVFAGVILIARS
ncbi:MAG: SMR family transporter [Bacteroides sp.]|nr:SMR family transporter [Prevotella sp.]MCM1408254.1 SMR family transporter [Treponema brennaborense]MCM1469578.1 SMR family transporter [Bacteroides sp.]